MHVAEVEPRIFPRGTTTSLRRVVAVFAAALIVATWPLWTPGGEIPQVPFVACLCGAPAWLDWLALGGMGVGLLLSLAGGDVRPLPRAGLAVFTACLGASVLLDQHRLQPWAYQYLIVGMVLSLAPTDHGARPLRALVISIYFWSAVSKIDAAFLESHGQLLLEGLLQSTGIDVSLWSEAARRHAGVAFPAGELCVAVLLTVRRTRTWGLVASIIMHSLLLKTLGPWGLGHKPGVLLWNGYFIAQNLVLFRRTSPAAVTAQARGPATRGEIVATLVVATAALLPVLESTGWWDHWPSWAVYSSRPAIVTWQVHESRLDDLPPTLRSCVGPPEPLSDWHPVNIDTWSFERLWCPVYPQERYRLALVSAIAERAGLKEDVRVRVEISPARWSGARSTTVLEGVESIRKRCRDCWLNTQPRHE